MNFGDLGKVETAQTYLDIAFNRGKTHAAEIAKNLVGDRFLKFKRRELDTINTVHVTLVNHLMRILKSFPNIQDLDPFYKELIACVVDIAQVRQSLGGVNWAVHRIQEIYREFQDKLRGSRDDTTLLVHKRAFFGRVSSVIKRLKDDFIYLDEARKQMKELPSFKTSIPTVVIAGIPNVGKSTLLKALTGSAPAIANYPFTTKQMMLGYKTVDGKKWQVIDTPGLLDRPLKNKIEQQAALALKHLAQVVVFVIDPTEGCGFPLSEQKHLLKEISNLLKVPVIIAINKADLATSDQLLLAQENSQNVVIISADKNDGIDKLVTMIGKQIK